MEHPSEPVTDPLLDLLNSVEAAAEPAPDTERDQWHQAAGRAVTYRCDRLVEAYQALSGRPVSEAMLRAFRNIAWTCSGGTMDTLVDEFTTLANER